MTAPTSNEPARHVPATDEPPDAAPRRRERRRRPAPPAHPFFRFVFPLFIVAAGIAVFLLWREGAKAVLDTTDGEAVFAVDDPAEPGFLAFATPTPTLLVAHVDAADALIGVTVLARTSLDDGGTLVVYSPDMLLDLSGDDIILDELYATGGAEALELAVGEYMGFGFTEDEPMVMNTERLGAFLEQVEPIPFFLADDLVRVDAAGDVEVVYQSGAGEFTGPELAEIYEWRNPFERDDGRFTRQLAIWEAWLFRIAEADDLIAATLPFNAGLPPYLRAFATGTVDLELVPAVPLAFDPENPFYILAPGSESWPLDKGREMVPLPVAYAPGVWPTVQLLDGTGDATNRTRFLPTVVAAGAEIAVVGNAVSFDVAETYVAYHDVVDAERAVELANALGVEAVFEEDLDQPAELTVTVGLDAADL